MSEQYSVKRRQVIKMGMAVCAAIPLARLAKAAESGAKVQESDDLAKQLAYQHDASKAPGRKGDASCKSCAFYQGKGDAEWGGCIVFGGKQVNAKGWCQSYRAKG